MESVGDWDSLGPDGTPLSGWVGGWRFTVALGKAAVPAALGSAGLVESGGTVAAPIGFDEVASLIVGAGADGRAVFKAIVGAGLVATGDAGFGGTGAPGAVAFGASSAAAGTGGLAASGAGTSGFFSRPFPAAAGGVGATDGGLGGLGDTEDTGAVAALGVSLVVASAGFGALVATGGSEGGFGTDAASGGMKGVGGPVRGGGIGVGGWLGPASVDWAVGNTDGPLVVAEPCIGMLVLPGTGGRTGGAEPVEDPEAIGASAALSVTRTVSRLSGTFEVFDVVFSGCGFTETAPVFLGGKTAPVWREIGTVDAGGGGGMGDEFPA